MVSPTAAQKTLKYYPLWLVLGGFGMYVVHNAYRLLDDVVFFRVGIGVCCCAVIPHVVSAASYQRNSNVRRIQSIYVWSGIALLFLSAVVACNGLFDQSVETRQATVTQKQVDVGRNWRKHYRLIVLSWRSGRSTERLEISAGTYRNVNVGQFVTIELHNGFFGFAWYGEVSPFGMTR